MSSSPPTFPAMTEPELARLAEEVAFLARPGDCLGLYGDLGAGKTTFARAFIRAFAGHHDIEIPSPTFTLVQLYDTPRALLAHADLYRLNSPEEAGELGLDALATTGVLLVEWPERAECELPDSRLCLSIADGPTPETRAVTLSAIGDWQARLPRLLALHRTIRTAGYTADATHLRHFQGDASARRYGRLDAPGQPPAVVMDSPRQPDGPPIRDGLPYSRIAHLAEDVRPFVAVATALQQAGLAAPTLLARDLDHGILVLEHLGDGVYGEALRTGADQRQLWSAAIEPLLALRRCPAPQALPLPDGSTSPLPLYDQRAMAIETELFPDWYWPAAFGAPIGDAPRADFVGYWHDIIATLATLPAGWVLRDYHSPNLIWRPNRQGLARVGILDFQDAMRGPAAYDLVSLLQDARLDVPEPLENELLAAYCTAARTQEADFDEDAFRFAYAALGAQRNTKILGIFARLARRDGKPAYLAHVPRIWGYLERDLRHPRLSALRAWYTERIPPPIRNRALTP